MPYEKTKIYIIAKIGGDDIRILSNESDSYYSDPLDPDFRISYEDFHNHTVLLYHISAQSQKGESHLNHVIDRLTEIKEVAV